MHSFKLFLFSMQMQFDIIKPITGSLPFSNTKHKGKEKLATKKKNEQKKYRIREYEFS